MKILFNIPVHENMDVVVNTIENIKKFVADPIIIFHVNPSFASFDQSRLEKYTNVIVNPNRLPFVKYTSMLPILMVNFYHTLHIDYDYHCIFYSNEMFIKPGIEKHVENYRCVFEKHFMDQSDRYEEMSSACAIPGYFDNQPKINNLVEGTMYTKELATKIFNFINDNLSQLLVSNTSIEETVIPTLAYMFTQPEERLGAYMHYQDWNREISLEQLHMILTPNQIINVGCTGYGIKGTSDQIFTIKPVQRDMSSKLRQAINNL